MIELNLTTELYFSFIIGAVLSHGDGVGVLISSYSRTKTNGATVTIWNGIQSVQQQEGTEQIIHFLLKDFFLQVHPLALHKVTSSYLMDEQSSVILPEAQAEKT